MINLKPITSENDDEICGLKADKSLVRHNEGSLADAFVYTVEYGNTPTIKKQLRINNGAFF